MFKKIYLILAKLNILLIYNGERWRRKKVGKIMVDSIPLVLDRVFILSFEIFPEKMLSENKALASSVSKKLFSFDGKETYSENFNELYSLALSDECVKSNLSNYYLLNAYYYSLFHSRKHEDIVVSDIQKAKSIKQNSIHLTRNEFIKVCSDYKKQKKQQKKEIRFLVSDKVKSDKLKLITPIELSVDKIPVILTIFTTLFLIGGFLYIKFLFYFFGFSVSEFYSIQDYLSSSVDVISATAMTAILGLASMIYGLSSAIDKDIYHENIGTIRKRGYLWPIILVTSLSSGAFNYYGFGKIPNICLYPTLFSLSFYISFSAPYWDYIKNRASLGMISFISIIFLINIGFVVKDKIESVVFNDRTSKYEIDLVKEYENNKSMFYFSGNSNYIFLMDDNDNSILVLPRSSVKQIKINRK